MDFLVDRFLGMNNQDISDNKKAKEKAEEKKKEAEGATGGTEEGKEEGGNSEFTL
jgi:hypothetical protein